MVKNQNKHHLVYNSKKARKFELPISDQIVEFLLLGNVSSETVMAVKTPRTKHFEGGCLCQ